jgi:CubicO group peptidase (beta-lactamase class C family)
MNSPSNQSIPRTSAIIEQGIADGLHIGAQIFASVHGKIIADAAFGLARPGVPMTTDHLMLWLSCSKPIAAVAIGQLWERGRLDLDDRASLHVPEFAARGKEAITIRQILNHTCGFRSAALTWTAEPWEKVVTNVCAAPLETNWVPGRKAGYHLAGSWYVLGEIVRRLDGRPYEKYVREEIFLPLEMNDSWFALSPETFRDFGNRIGLLHDTTGPTPAANFIADTEAGCALCRPGASGRGPIRELGFFHEMILGKGTRNGRKILSPQTVEALIARHRCGMFDHTFKHLMDWSLGFVPDNNHYGPDTPYGYGCHCSPRAVGHSGRQSSVGFCDPEFGLAVAMVFNGCPGDAMHTERMNKTLAALYEDLHE